jgi:hypothetical protein
MVMGAGPCNIGEWEPEHEWLARRARTCPPEVERRLKREQEAFARRMREVGVRQAVRERDRGALGQADVPPPVNWRMVLGWAAILSVTFAVFGGTATLRGGSRGGRVRA